MREQSILIVPACETGMGGGHLIRSAALLRSLRKAGGDAWLYLPGKSGIAALAGLEDRLVGKEACTRKSWSLVVLDRFKTSPAELALWSSLGPVVGIDEGGCRDSFDFLIDLLPGPPGRSAPNLLKPAFLPLPEKRRLSFYESARPFRLFVSFGAEDHAGLTVPAALALASARAVPGAAEAANPEILDEFRITGKTSVYNEIHITARFGPLCGISASAVALLEQAGIQVSRDEENIPLRESFSSCDLLITHFGLSAFEALSARVPVLLVSPGAYHETLAKNAGFVSAGKGKRAAARIISLLFTNNRLDENKLRYIAGKSEKAAVRWGLDRQPEDLGTFLLSWKPEIYRECPVCAAPRTAENHRLLARFPDRTYRRCRTCGTVFMDRTAPPAQEYNAAYFFDEYQNQYGKTYLEDFPALKENGKRRLAVIKALLKNRSAAPRLLDLGCAYGPFLEAAREEGFIPAGMDPSEDAVRHVRGVLKIPAVRGFFPGDTGRYEPVLSGSDNAPDSLFQRNSYTVITLWYVIEHLTELRAALELANKLLAVGGVLAFSTPSFGGLSRRKSLSAFLENSPGDHRTIWDPRSCAAILARFSFKVKKIVITGHHPERFPFAGRFLRQGAVYRFLLAISRLFGLGDTFEVYAVKTGDIQTGMDSSRKKAEKEGEP
jgi:2-polyprenyl-3-methyl-5-hydroxy-6-metoxy-1,4-benzoquinol methylase